MDFNAIIELAIHQGIWCVMFIWLLFDSRSKAEHREERLLEKLDYYNDALAENTKTLEGINTRVERIETELYTTLISDEKAAKN